MAHGRVGSDPREAVAATALEADGELREWCLRSGDLIGLHQAVERLLDRGGEHRLFGALPLLLEVEERLVEVRGALGDLLAEEVALRVLTAEREHRGTGDVRVVQVAGQQSAEIARVLARAAASARVRQELDSVDVAEDAPRLAHAPLGVATAALTVAFQQPADLLTVDVGRGKAELFLERLADHVDVAILAEDQRDHQPMIARPDLAIAAVIAEEGALLPGTNIGRMVRTERRGGVHAGRRVAHVAGGDRLAGRDRNHSPPHEDAVHDDRLTHGECNGGELVLGGDLRGEGQLDVRVTHVLPCSEGHERHEDVVVGMDPQDAIGHGLPARGMPGC